MLNPTVDITRPNLVLLVDNDDETRKQVKQSITDESMGRYMVLDFDGRATAEAAIKKLSKERVAVIAVDLILGPPPLPGQEPEFEPALEIIESARIHFPEARRLVYSRWHWPEAEELIRATGTRYALTEDVNAMILQIFLENELLGLAPNSPLVKLVLDAMNAGISIQDVDMNVVWANKHNCEWMNVELADIVGKKCWLVYHRFGARHTGCSQCDGCKLIQKARRRTDQGKRAIPDWEHDPELRYQQLRMLLPLPSSIGQVEVDGAVLLNRAGTQVVALIEVVRMRKEEWERETPPGTRLKEVVEAARAMTSWRRPDEAKGKNRVLCKPLPPCESVSVYYRPSPEDDRLFCFFTDHEPGSEPTRVLFIPELGEDYRVCLTEGGTGRQEDLTASAPTHFLWATAPSESRLQVLIDVSFDERTDNKPDELLGRDLAPYWRYVADIFQEAIDTRDREREREANAVVRDYVALTAEKHDQPPSKNEIKTKLQALFDDTVKHLKIAFNLVGCHIRKLDRVSDSLVKVAGFGPWYEMTDRERTLNEPFQGSSVVAANRKPRMILRPDIDDMVRGVQAGLSSEQKQTLKSTTAFITLPLLFAGRVLGTLTLQFGDDSLINPDIKKAVEAIGERLSGAMASLEMTHERYYVASFFRRLDESMFAPQESSGFEAEKNMIDQATDTLFALTHAEFVSYYKYDKLAHCYRHLVWSEQVERPERLRLPDQLPDCYGLIGKATQTGKTQFARDYPHDPDLEAIREALLEWIKNEEERRLAASISCLIVAPVRIDGEPEGALIAQARIANWMSDEDKELTREFADKIEYCLEAMRARERLDQELSARRSLADFHRGLMKAKTPEALNRLFLLTVTAGEWLGFSRAMLFLSDDCGTTFKLADAVGEVDWRKQDEKWSEANSLSREEKIGRALANSEGSPGGVTEAGHLIVLQREEEASLMARLEGERDAASEESGLDIRRLGQDHLFCNEALRCLLIPPRGRDVEYAVLRLKASHNVDGILVADRSFLWRATVSENEASLLQMLGHEFTLTLQALRYRDEVTRQEEEVTRLEAWRTLAARTSHKIGNILAAANGTMRRARRSKAERPDALEDLQGDLMAIRRILREYKNFATNQPCARIPTDVVSVLTRLVRKFNAIGENVRIVLDNSNDKILWNLDSTRMEEAIGELLENSLRFSSQVKVSAKVAVSLLHITVSDNGPGVPDDQRPRIFEPFFTIRADGSGLGLAIVKQIIENHGGTITECGSYGHGARFEIRIPR